MAGDKSRTLRVEVCGALRLVVDGAEVAVPGFKRQAVLALLALTEGEVVSGDSIADALWLGSSVRSERQAVQSHVSRIRRHLGPYAERLCAESVGYRLVLDSLDAVEARTLLEESRSEQDATVAANLLRSALSLWRGPVLAGLADVVEIGLAAGRLERLRQVITDELVSRSVEAGRAGEVVDLAADTVAEDPLREAGVLGLMRALAGNGETAEALRAAHAYRRRLVSVTGLDPSPVLAELEGDVASGALAYALPRAAPPDIVRSAARLIGRDRELVAVHRSLARERLVTVVGPGGVGKTRLVQQIIDETDGVVVVPLESLTDPSAIPHVLATAMGLSITRGDVLNACIDLLDDRSCLMVVDNCEHVVDGIRDVVRLILSKCHQVRILATSRTPIGLAVEVVHRLPPLAVPEHAGEQAPASVLFLERARRVRPGFVIEGDDVPLVDDIVVRLDGLPLAIELAAGRLSSLSVPDLHARLGRRLDLLAGPQPTSDERHRTVRAALEWSYDLLADDEQRLFRHLSVFPGGVDLDTAEWVASDLQLGTDSATVLGRLVDASMIQLEVSPRSRYRMLETMRILGRDRLDESHELLEADDRVVRWAVGTMERVEAMMPTADEPTADTKIRSEIDNLRRAWRLARKGAQHDVHSRHAAVAMVAALFDVVAYRDLIEVWAWAEELVSDHTTQQCPRAAAAFGTAAEAAYHDGDLDLAAQWAQMGLELAGEPGDGGDVDGVGKCLLAAASVALARGHFEAAAIDTHDVTCHRGHELGGVRALAALYTGNADTARAMAERAYADTDSPTLLAWRDYILGEIANYIGDTGTAESLYRRSIATAGHSGATFVVGVATVGLVTVLTSSGRSISALEGYREVIDYFARTGNWTHQVVTLRNLAVLLVSQGRHYDAALIQSLLGPEADSAQSRRSSRASERPLNGRSSALAHARKVINEILASAP